MKAGRELDGMIKLDSPLGKEFGFTGDKFDGYLWKTDDVVIISFIMSKTPGKGHFSTLLDAIWREGYTIHVPTPLGQMLPILEAKGFEQTWEWSKGFQDNVEIWARGPTDVAALKVKGINIDT